MVRVQLGEEEHARVERIYGLSVVPGPVDGVVVLVCHEVLGGEELVARGDDGGLDVALEGLDGFDLGTKRVHGSSEKRCARGGAQRQEGAREEREWSRSSHRWSRFRHPCHAGGRLGSNQSGMRPGWSIICVGSEVDPSVGLPIV